MPSRTNIDRVQEMPWDQFEVSGGGGRGCGTGRGLGIGLGLSPLLMLEVVEADING
jgi:hypothetical protein